MCARAPQIVLIISIEHAETLSLDIEHKLSDRGSGGEETHLLGSRESAVCRWPGAEVEAMNRAPFANEDMLLAASQILVRPNLFQNGKNVIIEAKQRMQTMLYRVPLLIPTRQLASDHRLAYGGVQSDRGIRQFFTEGYPRHKRGYAATDDCNFERGGCCIERQDIDLLRGDQTDATKLPGRVVGPSAKCGS